MKSHHKRFFIDPSNKMVRRETLIKHIKKCIILVLDEDTEEIPLLIKSSISNKNTGKYIYFTHFACAFIKTHKFCNLSLFVLANIILMFSFLISVFVLQERKENAKNNNMKTVLYC